MALNFPFEMFMDAANAKRRSQQQQNQDIIGMGQGMGSIGEAVGSIIQQQKRKQLMGQLIAQMNQQGAPQQGPPMAPAGYPQPNLSKIPPGQPMSVGGNTGQDVRMPQPIPTQGPGQPTSGIGAPAQDNTQQINALMTQLDPEAAIKSHFARMGQKPTSPWRVVNQMLSKNNRPVQQNEQTGDLREGNIDVIPTGRGNSAFGTGSITWDTATPEDQALAKALYEGNVQPGHLGYRDRSVATKLANEYAIKNGFPAFQSYSGDVHAGVAKDFASGHEGRNVLSLNTAIGHLNSAMSAYDNIQNLDVRLLNTPLNAVRSQTNDPNIIKLQTSLNALHGELATVFKGSGGTDQEIGHWANVLTDNLTPKQALAAMQQAGDLLNSRLDALNTMRDTGMGRPASDHLLSPHAKVISKAIKNKGGNSDETASTEKGWVYTPGLGGRANQANWKKQ